ncbi:hypothetical protein BDQ17DRAFT_1171333, partial [Cyathus striatus]
KTLIEANVTYWATSLLSYSYSYIAQIISTKGGPPFKIPEIRFVKAGVGIVHNATGSKTGGKSTTMRNVYLLEEFIENEGNNFIKFIHNGPARPLLDESDPLYVIAEFLCFMQHIQYEKTDSLAYVSDLQGVQSLEDDAALFGQGNVGSAFDKFESEHICNEYCEWFNLTTL